jgi:hypothetical protein
VPHRLAAISDRVLSAVSHQPSIEPKADCRLPIADCSVPPTTVEPIGASVSPSMTDNTHDIEELRNRLLEARRFL